MGEAARVGNRSRGGGGRASAARAPVDRLRALCRALPETTEKLAWGEPTWRVRGRLFAQLDDHHHGADHLAVWLPAPLGEQEAGWIGVRIDGRPDWRQVGRLVEQAYRHVAPPPRRRRAGSAPRG